jgi:tetratricopeptide (TPR) repeat protein
MELIDLETKDTIHYDDIAKTYNLDSNKPTLMITWSTNCNICLNLIERYNKCDLSMLNLITINVNKNSYIETLGGVIAIGEQLKSWNHSLNFSGNIEKGKKGFDNIFNANVVPLLIAIKDEKIKGALISYYLYPYKLLGSIFNETEMIKFIWNDSDDLNSLVWNIYLKDTDNNRLEKAEELILRSIELDKNYHNTDTYATLLYKANKYTEALKKAKEAIEIAKTNKIDYSNTNELIQKIIDKL